MAFAGEDERAHQQSFLRRMAAHYEIGAELARLAAEKAEQDELRVLGRMMVAEQTAEIEIMRRWWRSWYAGDLPPPTPEEHAAMPGMPPPGTIEELAGLSGRAFEERFFAVMLPHHQGAVDIAQDAWHQAVDPRLRLFAYQVRHRQRGQIDRMKAMRRSLADQVTGR